MRVFEDPGMQLGRRVTVADNEFDEWTGSGVDVRSVNVFLHPEDYPDSLPRMRPEDAGLVHVERNYMHHNARDGGGYGVTVSAGAYATIEGNVFDYNRHAVASDGRAHTGYVARFNYVLQGGFKQGSYFNQHFDVHGTALDDNGNNTGYGGSAGEYYEIAFNAIHGEQSYYIFGEFDGVRGTDVAAVTSGMWAYSSGGIGSWTKLYNKRAGSFADAVAADFDGNGRTDIAFSDGQTWRYSRDGRSALVTMREGSNVLPYPALKSLCIGRFDGGTRAKVISFIRTIPATFPVSDAFGERLVIWNGPGTDFSIRSLQNMR